MIDLLKIRSRDIVVARHLEGLSFLNYKNTISGKGKNGDYEYKRYDYNGIHFEFAKHRVESQITFRPHYYFNSNEHNTNDFNMLDCQSVIIEFMDMLDLWNYVSVLEIFNIEFGTANVIRSKIENFLQRLIYFRTHPFNTHRKYEHHRESFPRNKLGETTYYKGCKLYSKKHQFPEMDLGESLRTELKSNEKKFIKRNGIKTIDDLIKNETYLNWSNLLIEEMKHLLILPEGISSKGLTKKEYKDLKKFRHEIYWQKLLKYEPYLFNRKKVRYYRILSKINKNPLEPFIIDLRTKLDSLCEVKSV
jgi:hypothetical protein